VTVASLSWWAEAHPIDEKLLTTGNPDTERDMALFARLGLRPMPVTETSGTVHAEIIEAA